eukprot:765441-Hanusia_phi.AAC.3
MAWEVSQEATVARVDVLLQSPRTCAVLRRARTHSRGARAQCREERPNAETDSQAEKLNDNKACLCHHAPLEKLSPDTHTNNKY